MGGVAEETRSEALKAIFVEEMDKWPEDRRKELLGELMYWGSVVPIGPTLWHGILSQIESIASEGGIPAEEVIRVLFGAETADTFMLSFQVGLRPS